MQTANSFKALHLTQSPLYLNNVWDAASAAIVASQGAKALATSSASLAWSLGYQDGSMLPTQLLIESIERIVRITDLPLSVDIENGYSDSPQTVAGLINELVKLGVVGVNLEDGTDTPSLLAEKIAEIRCHFGDQIFINARTDVYLANLVSEASLREETLKRIELYHHAGADGAFIPGCASPSDFQHFANNCPLLLNAMVEDFNDLSDFHNAGVVRFSKGPTPFIRAYQQLISEQKSLSYAMINSLFT